MTLDEWGIAKGHGALLELGRLIFGHARAKQIYRYRIDPRTGKPGRIPPAEIMAQIHIGTEMQVKPDDFYAAYIREALAKDRRRLLAETRATQTRIAQARQTRPQPAGAAQTRQRRAGSAAA
jgi:hypothetical protein